jgi:hypothetical protein
MKLIVDKNDTGKTRMLIEQSLSQDVPIFALHNSKAESLRAKSLSYFGKVVRVVLPQDLTMHEYSGPILVDDLDRAFYTLLSAYTNSFDFSVVGATITED